MLGNLLVINSHSHFNRKSDLSEQCLALQKEKANLRKEKADAQIQIRELRQTSHALERKIESLTKELTR